MTPLGRPVLPEVKMIYASCEPSTCIVGSRALSLSMSALLASRSIKTAEVGGACSSDRRLPITIETPAAARIPAVRAAQVGFDRHVCRARLENAEHGDNLIDKPVNEQSDPHLGARIAAGEIMRQPIGTCIQFGIRESSCRRPTKPGHRVWRGPAPRTCHESPNV